MVKKTRILQSGRRRERERKKELPPKWVKHKIKPQNTKTRYENTANTKGFMDGQTWRRLKRIIIVVFQNSFSKFAFVVCNVWYTWCFEEISHFLIRSCELVIFRGNPGYQVKFLLGVPSDKCQRGEVVYLLWKLPIQIFPLYVVFMILEG